MCTFPVGVESFRVSSYMSARPPDSFTGPSDTFPGPPDTFPGSLDSFPGYIGPISFDGNSDNLALLVVYYLNCCSQFIYLVSSYMFPQHPDSLTGTPDTFPGPLILFLGNKHASYTVVNIICQFHHIRFR